MRSLGVFRIRIRFEDRPGVVHDTSEIILSHDANILTLEVLPNLMYFELELNNNSKEYKKQLMRDLAYISNITEVEEVKYINHKDSKNDPFSTILGDSTAIKKAKFRSKLAANSDSTILLLGESGTGKELFAKAIHMSSPRRRFPFYPVNCAALPETLLESELFGYEDGAFSGARKGGKPGLIEVANGSTIFFDEVGDLSLKTQAKLLRVLQERKVRRIGGYKEKSVDLRIIAATNKNLKEMVRKGEFREDLYFRLNVIPIKIPPLRERKTDIPLLVEHFLSHYSKSIKKPRKSITQQAMTLLKSYNYPGNVRELQNIIERAIILTPGKIIDANYLYFEDDKNFSQMPITEKPLKAIVAQVEHKAITEALSRHDSIRQAAKALGISHPGLIKKMRKLNIAR